MMHAILTGLSLLIAAVFQWIAGSVRVRCRANRLQPIFHAATNGFTDISAK